MSWFRRPQAPPDAVTPNPGDHPDTSRWRAMLAATEDAVLIADDQGSLLFSNAVADRLFAIRPRPDGGDDPPGSGGKLLAHTLSTELEELYRKAIHRRAPVETEVSLSHPILRTLQVRITPVSQTEFLLVLRDLTELRRLERVRRDFVANVSHELRTPLTSIKAMAETLLDGARTDEAVAPRFLQTIIHESDRLVRLSADLLDLSRVEARGVEKSPVEFAGLVQEVASRLSSQADKAGITLTNSVRPLIVAPADRDEMAQVVVNLLDNAIAYTPKGGSVTITASQTEQTISVSVADTGIGILSHDISRLFERFYRADKARSRASGGTGLGLSIVRHIVESHGGTVGVDSEYNKGSVFTFTLPKS